MSEALPLISRAEQHRERTAVLDSKGAYSFRQLLDSSAQIASALLKGKDDLHGERVGLLISPGFRWAAAQWAIWRAGGVAVPLPLACARPELEYFFEDMCPTALLADIAGKSALERIAADRKVPLLSCDEAAPQNPVQLPRIQTARPAMILYTSGTTDRPKGVVTTHDNINAQIQTLVNAWEWTADDRTVLCLPLHHVHGIINIVSCALWAGAVCDMLERFDTDAIWSRIERDELTVFMAVPTIYHRLITLWEQSSPGRRAKLSEGCKKLRLMVSGSAALPVKTLERWEEISGHRLVERYGMTEIGMALSNPLRGNRVPGSVGVPLPGVEVQLVDDRSTLAKTGMPGEIEVRGPSVFKEYWGEPEATRDAFRNGWFRTGDMSIVENGVYRILGRTSVDIIKSGGHKLSALEIEETLREHPAIAECAVLGVADQEWGERVAACVVLNAGNTLELEELRSWAKQRMAAYKVPSRLLIVEAFPRNAMGKVTKPALGALFNASVPR
jgi:malonyl-CoA/methylmalonyl-CoA synthetase